MRKHSHRRYAAALVAALAVATVAANVATVAAAAPTVDPAPGPGTTDVPGRAPESTESGPATGGSGDQIDVAPATPAAGSASPCSSTIAYGDLQDCSILDASEIDQFALTAPAFDAIVVHVTVTAGNLTPRVEVVDGASTTLCNSASSVVDCSLGVGGTYTIRVSDAWSSGVGNYRVAVESSKTPSACTDVTSLAVDGPAVAGSLSDVGELRCLNLLGASAGDVIRTRGGGGSTAVDVLTYRNNGTRLCSASIAGNYWNEQADCALTGAAPYRVFLMTSAAETPSYLLRFFRLNGPSGCTPITDTAFGSAPTTVGSLTDSIQQDCYSFAAPAFAKKLVHVVSTTGGYNRVWQVLDPAGAVVCQSGYYYDDRPTTCPLGAAGTYALVVWAFGSLGNYAVGMHDIVAGAGCSSIPDTSFAQSPLNGSFTDSTEVRCASFTATAGDRMRFDLYATVTGVSQTLRVIDASGNDICSGSGRFDCSLTGPAPYRAVIWASGPGSFGLRVNRLNAPTGCGSVTLGAFGDQPGTQASIDVAHEVDCYTFTGASFGADLVRVVVTAGSFSPQWEVRAPDGTSVCSSGQDTAQVCALGPAGTYSILVFSYYEQIGQYTMGVWNATNPSPCTSIPSLSFTASGIADSIATVGEVDCLSFSGVASDLVRFQVSSTTVGMNVQGQVLNGSGTSICSFWGSASMDCQLSGPGPYRLVVHAQGNQVGYYEVRAARLNNPQGCAALGQTAFGSVPGADGSLDTAREQDCFTFTETTFGARELFRVVPTAGFSDALLDVRKASDGTQVCTAYASSLAACQFSATGSYTVIVLSSNGGVGTYRLGRWNTRTTPSCASLGQLGFDKAGAAVAVAAAGQLFCHDFTGSTNARIRSRVTSLSAGSQFSGAIIDAGGSIVCSFSYQTECTLTGSAPFRFLTFGTGGDVGNVELRGWQLNDPGGCTAVQSAAFGFGPVEQSLADPREADCFKFTGAVGDEFNVTVSNLDLPNSIPYIELVNPAGDVVCSGNGTITNCTLQVTGPHAVIVGSNPWWWSGDVYGRYRLEGVCNNPACGTESFTIGGFRPTSAGAGSSVTVDLRGRVLSLGDQVSLQRTGSNPINGQSMSVSEDRRALSVLFDLAGATPGFWDVVVHASTGDVVTITNGFQVVAPTRPAVRVGLVARDRFVPGRSQTVTLNLENTGNVDALGVPVIITGLPASAIVRPTTPLQHWEPATSSFSELPWDQSKVAAVKGNQLVMPLLIGRVPAGARNSLSFTVTIPTQSNYRLNVRTFSCFNASGALTGSIGSVAVGAINYVSCAGSMTGAATTLLGAAGFIPGGPCVGLAIGAAQQTMFNAVQGAPPWAGMGFADVMSTGLGAAACVASFVPGGQLVSGALSIMGDMFGAFAGGWNTARDCTTEADEGADQHWVTSMDPNEIVGPAGGGPAHAITGTAALPYTIHFENMATASAPAQEVVVTDHLDPNVFDLNNFSFGSMGWGSESYTPSDPTAAIDTVIDLRPGTNLKVHLEGNLNKVTGVATWKFTSLDPATDALPEDPDVGFLPPNSVAPNGEGAVSFTVPLKNPTNGQTVTNQAEVVFDLNPAIVTNVWSNLIDRDLPTSSVAPLATPNAGPDIAVSWSGSDPTSGVRAYTVLVAEDDGPYQVWKDDTTETSGTYTGVPGHSYRFYSIAYDHAGNIEAAPPVHDASTTLLPPGSGFHAVTPFRALDSRSGPGFTGAIGPNSSVELTLAGVGVIPATAKGVVMNVTATGGTAASYLTVYPGGGGAAPTAANLLFGPGQTVPNLVTVGVGANGKVSFFNQKGSVHVIADVVGYFDDGSGPGDLFNGIAPQRLLDSRGATGGWGSAKLGEDQSRDVMVRGAAGVPVTATAVVMNVTATGGTKASYLQAYPSGVTRPSTANVLFGPGQTVPNLVTVGIGSNGKVSFYNQKGSVHVIADVVGYFDPSGGGRFHAVAPVRALDSRGLTGGWGSSPLGADQARALSVTGGSVPWAATGVVANVTATGGTAASFVSVAPTPIPKPVGTANLLFAKGQTVPNAVMVGVGAAGKIDLFNQQGTVHVIVDVAGYYAPF